MKNIEITCDCCSADISVTGEMPAFRISLKSESLPSNSNIRFAVVVYPQFEREMHFCGIPCLKKYIAEKYK